MTEGTVRPVALITGAAQRIGRQIALTLAESGWNIALHCRHSVTAAEQTRQELATYGGEHHLLRADLSSEDETRELFEQTVKAFGRVDAVINNASVFEFDDADSFDTAGLVSHMLPNLAAPLLLAQALHRHICESRPEDRGVVVNLLDQKLSNPNPDFLSYTLSKSALKTATLLLAQALAPHVRVAGVSPGMTLRSHLQTDEAFERTHHMAPLGRASTPIDVARSVRFILESPAITGVDLVVDGGQHLVPMDRDFSMLATHER